MQLELLQSAVGGDLVLGECKMRVSDVVAAGTVHSWFPFIDAADPQVKAAELLMAIRARSGKPKKSTKSKNKLPVMVCFSDATLNRQHRTRWQNVEEVLMQAKPASPEGTVTRASSLPVPLALGAAVILGVLSFAKTKRPIYYTVEEGDNLCTIGECFNQDYRMMYDRNKHVISDPHVIYPGDRIRIA